jgi:hypothetical protein
MSLEEAVKALPDLVDKIMPKQESALAEAVRLDAEGVPKEDTEAKLDETKPVEKKEASS